MKVFFLALVLLLAGVLWQVSEDAAGRAHLAWLRDRLPVAEAAPTATSYLAAEITRGELRRVISAVGSLSATVNIEVGSQLSGQLDELFVDFNDSVTRDQPLARLDQRSFKARVDEARAALEMGEVGVLAADARLERARIDVLDREAQRAVFEARIDSARVKLEAAERDRRRKESLREQRNISEVEVENSRTNVAAAAAALREAEATLRAHEQQIAGGVADVRRAVADLDTAVATMAQRRAQLAVAEIELDRTTIRAPIDGVIVGRNVNEGQTLATALEAKTLFVVAGDLTAMELHARVDEADIGRLAVGQRAEFTVDAHPGRQFPAVVTQIRQAPQVFSNVVTYIVVLAVENPDRLLLPGMTAMVGIEVSRSGPVLKLPLAALRFTPDAADTVGGATTEPERGIPATVWRLRDDGKTEPVMVGLGDDDLAHAALLDGPLAEGDRVVVGAVAPPAANRLFGIRLGL